MNKVLYAFLSLLAFTSCVNSYNIQGTSNVSDLDGRMHCFELSGKIRSQSLMPEGDNNTFITHNSTPSWRQRPS